MRFFASDAGTYGVKIFMPSFLFYGICYLKMIVLSFGG